MVHGLTRSQANLLQHVGQVRRIEVRQFRKANPARPIPECTMPLLDHAPQRADGVAHVRQKFLHQHQVLLAVGETRILVQSGFVGLQADVLFTRHAHDTIPATDTLQQFVQLVAKAVAVFGAQLPCV